MQSKQVASWVAIALGVLPTVVEAQAEKTPAKAIKSDWHMRYHAIPDAEAHAFVARGIVLLRRNLGAPAIPVERVQLRLSRPINPDAKFDSGFQLCEITDSDRGIFTIYTSRPFGHASFYFVLAHEIAHLRNALVFDWYAEGLATLFGEELLKKEGMDWSPFLKYLEEERATVGPHTAHAVSYFLLKDLKKEAGERVHDLFRHAVYSDKQRTRMHIDIDRWIQSLPVAMRGRVVATIARYSKELDAAVGHSDQEAALLLPKQLERKKQGDRQPKKEPTTKRASSEKARGSVDSRARSSFQVVRSSFLQSPHQVV